MDDSVRENDPLAIMEKPAFEVHGLDGHVWKIYPDGMIEGFPEDGSFVINRIPVMFHIVDALGAEAVENRIPKRA